MFVIIEIMGRDPSLVVSKRIGDTEISMHLSLVDISPDQSTDDGFNFSNDNDFTFSN